MNTDELLKLLPNDEETVGVVKYLQQFGYLQQFMPKGLPALPTGAAAALLDMGLENAVKEAQKVLGIEADGIIGPQTLKACLTIPRCGRPDFQAVGENLNRWALDKANGQGLVYCIKDYINTIPRASQDEIIMQSWGAWQSVCNLKILATNDPNQADIVISCSASRNEEFGTAGNVLAWAYLPQGNNFSGKLLCKFDLAERWAILPTDQGILLLAVATHEFGHLLGLDHTSIRGELMFPTYDKRIVSPQLRYDVPQVVERYGKLDVPTPPPPPTGNVNDIGNWDAVNRVTGEKRRLAA